MPEATVNPETSPFFISKALPSNVPWMRASEFKQNQRLAPAEAVIVFAEPPLEMQSFPPELTVILFAVPPLETQSLPPELIVTLFAIPPLWM